MNLRQFLQRGSLMIVAPKLVIPDLAKYDVFTHRSNWMSGSDLAKAQYQLDAPTKKILHDPRYRDYAFQLQSIIECEVSSKNDADDVLRRVRDSSDIPLTYPVTFDDNGLRSRGKYFLGKEWNESRKIIVTDGRKSMKIPLEGQFPINNLERTRYLLNTHDVNFPAQLLTCMFHDHLPQKQPFEHLHIALASIGAYKTLIDAGFSEDEAFLIRPFEPQTNMWLFVKENGLKPTLALYQNAIHELNREIEKIEYNRFKKN